MNLSRAIQSNLKRNTIVTTHQSMNCIQNAIVAVSPLPENVKNTNVEQELEKIKRLRLSRAIQSNLKRNTIVTIHQFMSCIQNAIASVQPLPDYAKNTRLKRELVTMKRKRIKEYGKEKYDRNSTTNKTA